MTVKGFLVRVGTFVIALSLLISSTSTRFVTAQSAGPVMLHPRLDVRPVVTGLNLPTTIAFVSANELFVLEKNTGTVQYVVDGAIDHTAL